MKEVKIRGKKVNIDKNTQGVYALWVKDYLYIGSGFLMERTSSNCSKLRRNVHFNPTLQKAYNKYGNTRVEILCVSNNAESARIMEQEYINYFKKVSGITVCNSRKSTNGCSSKAYNTYSRLTADKVKLIKIELRDNDISVKELANKYNCSENAISKIKTNVTWKNVEI